MGWCAQEMLVKPPADRLLRWSDDEFDAVHWKMPDGVGVGG